MLKISNNVFEDTSTGYFLNLMRSCDDMYIFNIYKANGELVKSCINIAITNLEDMFKNKELKFVALPI